MLTLVFPPPPPSPVILLSSCEAFRWDSAKRLSPLGSPAAKLLQYEGSGSAQDQLTQPSSPFQPSQRLHRTKRHRELVRTQPRLVHSMAVPEMEEPSRSNAGVDLSQLELDRNHMEENLQVEDKMKVKMRLSSSHQREI